MPTLEPASAMPPTDLSSMLLELGDGEAGFSGTPFGRGELNLTEYLDQCVKGEDPRFRVGSRDLGLSRLTAAIRVSGLD